MSNEYEQRKSAMLYGQLYFWTTTINNWKHLLAANEMKLEIIQSLQWLTAKELVTPTPGSVPTYWGKEGKHKLTS